MGTVARKRIGILTGDPKTTSVKVVVFSLTDAAITVEAFTTEARTGTPAATLTVNASSGANPKLAIYCNDRGSADAAGVTHVGWVGSGSLTGLSPGTWYYLKLTQGSVVETDASTCTAPAAGTDFDLFIMSCDLPNNDANEPQFWHGPGIHAAIKDKVSRRTRPAFLCFGDDVGYPDGYQLFSPVLSSWINDSTLGKDQGGIPFNVGEAYGYGLAYFAWLGLMEETDTSIPWHGRDEYRSWNFRNMPTAWSWGDHEFTDGIGWNFNNPSSSDANWAVGYEAFQELFGLLQPTPTIANRDTAAIHWTLVLGDMEVTCLDCVTNGSGHDGGTPRAWTSIFGSDQIEDVLDSLQSAAPFKVLMSPYIDIRPWKPPPWSSVTDSGQYGSHPDISRLMPAEWQRLYFDQGEDPPSIMDSAKTNGTESVLLVANGDIHYPAVDRHYGYQEDAGIIGTGLRLDLTVIHMAPANHQTVGISTAGRAQRESGFANGMQGYYWNPDAQHIDDFEAKPNATTNWSAACLWIEVRGSRTPKDIRAVLLRADRGNETAYWEAWAGVYRVGSNRPRNRMSVDRGIIKGAA